MFAALECLNDSAFTVTVSITLKNKILEASIFYQRKKDYLVEYFEKTDFTRKRLQGVLHGTVYSVYLARVKTLSYAIRIILAILFFQNCVCLDYLWVENVQDGVRQET